MRVPLVVLAAMVAEASPLLAQVGLRRRPRGARAWVLLWCGFLLAMDCWSGWLAARGEHNLWLFYVVTPVSLALALWPLSGWQRSDLWRLTYRVGIVPFVAVWGVLTWLVEDTSAFSQAAEPMAKLVGLAAAAFVLFIRSHHARGDLRRQEWFWISGGMTLYFGASASITPLGALLVGTRPDLVLAAFELKAVLDIGAFLLITRGILCPSPR